MIGDSSIEITVSRLKAKAVREELNTWYRWVSLSYKETKGWLSSHFVISGPPKDIEWFRGYLEREVK